MSEAKGKGKGQEVHKATKEHDNAIDIKLAYRTLVLLEQLVELSVFPNELLDAIALVAANLYGLVLPFSSALSQLKLSYIIKNLFLLSPYYLLVYLKFRLYIKKFIF